ncbi:hypothetical protein KQ876_01440 [Mycoplasma sp. CSL7491-lung]|uniref:hypothetical protein n=1 Tax=Mycoplasma sp. CSL7491-lung TaxID=549718 RepID=UPI001C105D92|nr:hypothetical protein [Mycoplasma sp. CSL7491-lung]MBU4692869.1 hypothetical protein [Mycoplasma sp. CSL7491-lung]
MKNKKIDKIQLFKLYKIKDRLKKSIEEYNKDKVEYLLPIMRVDNDLLLGKVIFNYNKEDQQNYIELYDHNSLWEMSMLFDNFYRMNATFFEFLSELDDQFKNVRVSEVNELAILDKVKFYFTQDDSFTKLTYVYPQKKEVEKNLYNSH